MAENHNNCQKAITVRQSFFIFGYYNEEGEC